MRHTSDSKQRGMALIKPRWIGLAGGAIASIAAMGAWLLPSTGSVLLPIAALAGCGIAVAAWLTHSNHADHATNQPQDSSFADVTLQAISDAVISIDAQGDVVYCNASAEKLTGWPASEARGMALGQVFRLMRGSEHGMVEHPAEETLRHGTLTRYDQNSLLLTREGRPLAIDASISPIRGGQEHIVGAVVAFRDVQRERRLSNKLAWQARHDALTGLFNRNEFEYRLKLLFQSARHQGREHTLLYIDLDQFKVVNDTCGHLAGDSLLKQLTALLQNEVRDRDTLARLGGDEFGVLLHNCSGEDARRIASQLLCTIQQFRFRWRDNNFQVGASIGMVHIDNTSQSVTQLLADADSACYTAKDAGRNRVQVYTEQNSEISRRDGELRWVSVLTEALEQNRLQLYYQRIAPANLQGDKAYYEVLLRLLDNQQQLISGDMFLPAAERYNLMTQIDRWVLTESLKRLQHSPEHLEGLHLCSINLSGQSVGDHQFLDFVSEQLERYNKVPPEKICFEITETAVITNMAQAVDFINTLRVLGCRFALDDFGSGLSSFGYLKNLPVDILKIDGVFVRDMLHDPINQALVKSISDIGHVMDKLVVAEFVSDDHLLEAIRDCGVDYVQGYAIHQPQPLSDLLESREGRGVSS
jgi:diguanylate cyclase (GGDEF)-like protein/PAS domain S-box-containing protein